MELKNHKSHLKADVACGMSTTLGTLATNCCKELPNDEPGVGNRRIIVAMLPARE